MGRLYFKSNLATSYFIKTDSGVCLEFIEGDGDIGLNIFIIDGKEINGKLRLFCNSEHKGLNIEKSMEKITYLDLKMCIKYGYIGDYEFSKYIANILNCVREEAEAYQEEKNQKAKEKAQSAIDQIKLNFKK